MDTGLQERVAGLLHEAGVQIDGSRPQDIQVHDPRFFARVIAQGSLGLGESYMDGWWDCERLDEFICRALRAGLDRQVRNPALLLLALKSRLLNLQSPARAWQVGQQHYDTGNELFEAMLDPTMSYSCGYWARQETLEQAQRAKLELICSKLQLKPGMTLLDIGCGWGGLMRHAAERNIEPVALLQARLFPDMFPLVRQVQIATDTAKFGAARLAGVRTSLPLRGHAPAVVRAGVVLGAGCVQCYSCRATAQAWAMYDLAMCSFK